MSEDTDNGSIFGSRWIQVPRLGSLRHEHQADLMGVSAMRNGLKFIVLALGLFLSPLSPFNSSTRADIVAYSDTTNATGFGYNNGLATTGDNATRLVADDLYPIVGGQGYGLTSFTFSVVNFNAVAVHANADVEFFSGSASAPSTLLYSVVIDLGTLAANSAFAETRSTTDAAPFFTLPSVGSTLWAGVAFDNNGGATGYATSAQLASLGQLIYAPPTIGSSMNFFFQSTGDFTGPGSNPPGGLLFFGGSPPADFFWQLTSSVPEPSSLILFGRIGLFLTVGAAVRKRFGRRSR